MRCPKRQSSRSTLPSHLASMFRWRIIHLPGLPQNSGYRSSAAASPPFHVIPSPVLQIWYGDISYTGVYGRRCLHTAGKLTAVLRCVGNGKEVKHRRSGREGDGRGGGGGERGGWDFIASILSATIVTMLVAMVTVVEECDALLSFLSSIAVALRAPSLKRTSSKYNMLSTSATRAPVTRQQQSVDQRRRDNTTSRTQSRSLKMAVFSQRCRVLFPVCFFC